MVHLSIEERITAVKDLAFSFGMPLRHAEVLSKISVRDELDSRVLYQLTHFEGYKKMIAEYKKMCDDPTAFYYEHKTFHNNSGISFLRYGTVSYAYSYASPYQHVMILLQDAREAKQMTCLQQELDRFDGDFEEECEEDAYDIFDAEYYEVVGYDEDGNPIQQLLFPFDREVLPNLYQESLFTDSYSHDFFDEQRLKRFEKAFQQDLRSNKIPENLVAALFAVLKYNSQSVHDYYGTGDPGVTSKKAIMDSFYCFFSSVYAKPCLMQWNEVSSRDSVIDQFTYRFFNDPKINPALVDMDSTAVGSRKYKEACAVFGDQLVYARDGSSQKRSEIDGRKCI